MPFSEVEPDQPSHPEDLLRDNEGSNVPRDVLIQALQDNKIVILRYLQRVLGNHHDAEEAFQEIGLKMCRSQGLYDIQRPALPWLMAIAKRIVLDIVRTRTRHRCRIISNVDMGDRSFVSKYPKPKESRFPPESNELVDSAISGLPVQYRKVLQLILEGLSYPEIAQILGLTKSNVAIRKSRAVDYLRNQIQIELLRDSA